MSEVVVRGRFGVDHARAGTGVLWRVAGGHPGDPLTFRTALQEHAGASLCQPTIETAYGPGLRASMLYRASCLGCAHRGPVVPTEAAAVVVAVDHAFPGWRLLRPVPRPPQLDEWSLAARRLDWYDAVAKVVPAGWLEQGGPVRTVRRRDRYGLVDVRHVPLGAPGGGYEMAATLNE